MELIVGVLVVLGLLAVVTRFITRDASGEIRLPRIVDDSIGMWALRRVTGRRLWERSSDDENRDDLPVESGASDGTRAALGAIAAANAASPSVAIARPAPIASRRVTSTFKVSPTPVHDLRRRQLAESHRTGMPTSVVPVIVRRGRRRDQARRKRTIGWAPRFAAMGSVAAVMAVAIIVLGVVVLPRGSQGEVLDSTGRPNQTAQSQIAVASPSASGAMASAFLKLPTPTAKPTATPRPTARATPGPTPVPTPRPTPKPTPTPTPPPPPIASITCSSVGLTVTCNGTGSTRAVKYVFAFEAGPTRSGPSPIASNTYDTAGTYTITLTVYDAKGRAGLNPDEYTITIP